jgi:hypothetical protein
VSDLGSQQVNELDCLFVQREDEDENEEFSLGNYPDEDEDEDKDPPQAMDNDSSNEGNNEVDLRRLASFTKLNFLQNSLGFIQVIWGGRTVIFCCRKAWA